jgi:hypothetical protein
MSEMLEGCCSYTFFANLLHFPAGAVPVTTVRPDEAKYHTADGESSYGRKTIIQLIGILVGLGPG